MNHSTCPHACIPRIDYRQENNRAAKARQSSTGFLTHSNTMFVLSTFSSTLLDRKVLSYIYIFESVYWCWVTRDCQLSFCEKKKKGRSEPHLTLDHPTFSRSTEMETLCNSCFSYSFVTINWWLVALPPCSYSLLQLLN